MKYTITKTVNDLALLRDTITSNTTFAQHLVDINVNFLDISFTAPDQTYVFFDSALDDTGVTELTDIVTNFTEPTNVVRTQQIEVKINPDSNAIRIQRETTPTNRLYRATGLKFETDGTTNQNTFVYGFPYSINILSVIYSPNSTIKDGDILEFTVTVVVGVIVAQVHVGDTVLHVNSTATQLFNVGRYAILSDGVNTADLGKVLAIDMVNHTITVSTASTADFAVMTPITLDTVFTEVFNADGTFTKGMHLEPQATYNVGNDTFQASYVPTDPAISLIFKAVDSGVRSGIVRVQHFY